MTEADIVDRLSRRRSRHNQITIDPDLCQDVADACAEIVRLRAERDAAARDMRERAAAWHDEQCYGGHCGETTADKVFRQRHNKMHEESAAAILALPDTPAVMATSRKDAT